LNSLEKILRDARRKTRSTLLETEGLALLQALGFRVPAHRFVEADGSATADDLRTIDTKLAVVKVVSADITHKTDVGGVVTVENNPDDIATAIAGMKHRLQRQRIAGFSIHEFVPYDRTFGHELLLGVRWTEDFGPVIVLGAGGLAAETISARLRDDGGVALFAPSLTTPDEVYRFIRQSAAGRLATEPFRGVAPSVGAEVLAACIERMRNVAEVAMPHDVRELEINPLVAHDGDLYALDVVAKLGDERKPAVPARPLHKLRNLLRPQSIAIAGVSQRMNPGHVILTNLLSEGFDRTRIHVVKPNVTSIDGCRCYPSISALPERVDLFVLSLDAAQVPRCVSDIVDHEAAESVIVIPGGLEEKADAQGLVAEMQAAIEASRRTEWQGPLINGSNSLGIDSRPGGYNTIFIPDRKIGGERPQPDWHKKKGKRASGGGHLAVISQSGAFAVARQSKFRGIRARYTITVGNQMDVTIGDYLDHLRDDSDIHTFAVYVEGFRTLDGLRFVRAAREITEAGKAVILYRAGRTRAGALASASHTASVAGDWTVTRALAANAGILLADTIEDFEDLTALSCFLHDKSVKGWNLGAVSNAGFECVALADNQGHFSFPTLGRRANKAIRRVLEKSRLDRVVDIHNPLDLTPMAGEEGYETAFRAVLEDPVVDVAVFGCVPLTPALNTMSAGRAHSENVESGDALPARVGRIFADSKKAFVAIVDGGSIYNAMADAIERRGIPTFRTADRALKLFDRYCGWRLRGR
jgi:acyl-CoA synthetase (NDP forming)